MEMGGDFLQASLPIACFKGQKKVTSPSTEEETHQVADPNLQHWGPCRRLGAEPQEGTLRSMEPDRIHIFLSGTYPAFWVYSVMSQALDWPWPPVPEWWSLFAKEQSLALVASDRRYGGAGLKRSGSAVVPGGYHLLRTLGLASEQPDCTPFCTWQVHAPWLWLWSVL